MTEVNPFEHPPLIEWDQCITEEELIAALEVISSLLSQVPWYRPVFRFKLRVTQQNLCDLYYWIRKGKPTYVPQNY